MSANANSFSWDDNDLWDQKVYITNHDLPGVPQPRVNLHRLTGANGEVSQGATFEAFTLTLECAVVAATGTLANTYYDELVEIFEATFADGEKELILGEDATIYYNAVCMSPFRKDIKGINGFTFTLEFRVTDAAFNAVL